MAELPEMGSGSFHRLSATAGPGLNGDMKEKGFTKVEGPFDPAPLFKYEASLPPSIWSSVLLSFYLISDDYWEKSLCAVFRYHIAPQVIAFIITLVLQVSFVVYIAVIVLEEQAQMCSKGDAYLRLICVAVFGAKTLSDLSETWAMHYFVRNIPNWTTADEKVVKKACVRTTNFPLQKYTKKTDPFKLYGIDLAYSNGETEEDKQFDEEVTKPAVGMKMKYRLPFYIFCVLPKFAIAIGLFIFGSGHILLSDKEETYILNTVASVFIFEIDDVLYYLMVSSPYRQWLEAAGKYEVTESEISEWDNFFWKICFFVVSSVSALVFWC